MTRSHITSILFTLAVVAPLALGQFCYVTVANGDSFTQCSVPPYFTRVEVIDYSMCSYSGPTCLHTRGGEQFTDYLTSESAIPLPTSYVSVKYFQDANCTMDVPYNLTEYYGNNRNCTQLFGFSPDTIVFSAQCNETHAHLQRYNTTECNNEPVFDEVYPLQQCYLSSQGYVFVTCKDNSSLIDRVPSFLLILVSIIITFFGW